MNNDLKEKVIIPAWNIIKEDTKIKKFYIFPGLLSIIFLTILLVYQSIYTYVKVFGNNEKQILEKILNFLESDYGFEAIILLLIFFIVYFLSLPIFEGGLIKYIDFKNKGKPLSSSEALGEGLYKFLPLFEYNNMFSEFKIISILNGYLFIIRFIGIEYLSIINYIFVLILILGLIVNILFAYSKYPLVLNNKGIFDSIGESAKITILNLRKTIKLYFLIFFLNLRVIVNFIIFLLFPIMIVAAIGLITTKFLLLIAVTILTIIFIVLILILGYLTAVLDVFKTSLWYYAYEEGKKRLEE